MGDSKLTQVVDKTQFLVIVGLSSLFPCCLLDGRTLSFLGNLYSHPLPSPSSNQKWFKAYSFSCLTVSDISCAVCL